VVDLLNFSFWSERDAADMPRYSVSYAGQAWTGYWSLCAAINRAIDVCRTRRSTLCNSLFIDIICHSVIFFNSSK